jgi:hypothetical protein
MSEDITFVQQYEPILHFHRDENFFPMALDGYIQHCSLHVVEGNQGVMVLPSPYVALGDLSGFSSIDHYLVYADRRIADEVKAQQLAAWIERQRTVRGPRFDEFKHKLKETAERLGINLMQVFKPFHMRSEILHQALANYDGLEQQAPTYYYRLSREGNYTILQYWFFYAYNDFATSHCGSNDHEGDWENSMVILQDEQPRWAAYASHGGGGAENRCVWDTAHMELAGTHPVVYVGAGSHASYFSADLNPIEKPFIPGNVVIGAHEHPWSVPQSLDHPWITDYKGRWGARQWDSVVYEAGDVQGGPPTGPKFNRDGTIRQAWANPLAYAGLVEE